VYPEYRSVLTRLNRWVSILGCFAGLFAGALASVGQSAPAKPPSTAASAAAKAAQAHAAPLLPDSFAGWVSADPPKAVTDPAQADQASVAALKEYDFTDGALATYKRDGETLFLRALRFNDATGAYGAYSFYRPNGWPREQVGTGAASNHNRVLFWKGNTVVDATFSHIGPMSGSELRELAGQIPDPDGAKALIPPVLANLPKASLDPQTTHYAVGPAGYVGGGGVLPAELVGFDRGAETVTATYGLTSGPATLTIIDYPTPQMAAAQERAVREYIKAGSQAQNTWPQPLKDSDVASLEVRRSGPLVVLVSGDAVPDESHKLIGAVHYDADLISVPQPMESEVAKTGRLLLGIAILVVIGSGAAILLGFFLGGGRALYRVAHGKPASTVYDEEFISLELREKWVDPVPAIDTSHPKG
jgi:hypothetical protein